MRAVLIVVFDFCLLCRCGLIQIKCIQSMPFALNVLLTSYSTFTPILYCRLGLRIAVLRGELKMDRHSKSLSTPALVFHNKNFMLLAKGGPHERGGERGVLSFKKVVLYCYWLI